MATWRSGAGWRQRARQLKQETYALYLACRDSRVPWWVRLLAAGVVAYAFSPIDLIPDPIPLLGHLDDLLLIPLGVLLVRALIPPSVMEECRAHAQEALAQGKPVSRVAGAVIVGLWLFAAALVVVIVTRLWF
jgi:uncharacterized membrane protein YkvA (DUF1232 family)